MSNSVSTEWLVVACSTICPPPPKKKKHPTKAKPCCCDFFSPESVVLQQAGIEGRYVDSSIAQTSEEEGKNNIRGSWIRNTD